jgi:hypothetical protein
MAKLIQAIATYGPRINLMEAANTQRFMDVITQRTTLSTGVVKNVQESEVETLINLLREGRPVHTGVAIFTPSVNLDGSIEVKVRVDKRIVSALNSNGWFSGKLSHPENVGKTSQALAALWNEEHPDDPIVAAPPANGTSPANPTPPVSTPPPTNTAPPTNMRHF